MTVLSLSLPPIGVGDVSDTPVTMAVFERAMDALGHRIDQLTDQVRGANGRVGGLETMAAGEAQKVRNIERQMFRDQASEAPETTALTRRDLAVFGGAIFVLVEVVRWLPALLTVGKGAP